jgi:OmpA-OmpF porin, OOP family
MAESLFASLLHTSDKGNISQIASTLGESEQNVSRGMEASIASVLGAAMSKADDPGALRNMLDLVPGNLGDLSWSKMAAGLGPGSPWISMGRQLLAGIFRSNDMAVANAVARDSGVSPATAISLLAMAAPLVLSGLNRRMREQAWSIRGLGSALQRESSTIRSALPAGVADLLWPSAAPAVSASPIIAQSVQRERSSAAWLGALALALAALGCFWLWSHARKPVETAAATTTGEANRVASDYVYRRLPTGVELSVPPNGLESRMVDVINGTGDQGAWLDFDRIQFDSGSATLRRSSSEQLDNVAAIMKAYPNVNLTIGGYTDSVGSAQPNIDLSLSRAENVKSELVSRGISPDRITAQGFGEAASADNSTDAARASNRRVSVQVTQR